MSDIFALCKNGDEEGVRRVIAADRAVVHARDTRWVSCLSPDIACRIYIIVHVDPHLISHLYYIQYNTTPLHYAAQRGHTSIVQLLLQAGANPTIKNYVTFIFFTNNYYRLIHYLSLS